MNSDVVGEEGIEPSIRKEHDFESCAYTSSATRPNSISLQAFTACCLPIPPLRHQGKLYHKLHYMTYT